MKRLLIIPILMIAGIVKGYSQTDTTKGVAFEHGLNWQGILQKAKMENKFVFVDCYASWCGPCKIMDKKVYANDSVGAFINDKFISVRIQMDTTQKDDADTRHWYSTADVLGQKYHIGEYPSYLFFSPDGRAVHKALGEMDSKDFLRMARAAMDENQQYYTLLTKYRNGEKNYTLMPVLVSMADNLGQDSILYQVARDYVCHYLTVLTEEKLWTRENIQFVYRYRDVVSYGDKMFQLYYQNRKMIDSAMKEPGVANNLINYVIYRDEIEPSVEKSLRSKTEPNWRQLKKNIERSYGEYYAMNNVVHGRVEYYHSEKEWGEYVKYFIWQQEANGIESWTNGRSNGFALNNNAYEVFQYGNRKWELRKALSWVNRSLSMAAKPYAFELDTKANILYKLGRKQEAMVLEEHCHELTQNKQIQTNYQKMKNGLPTWLSE